MYLQSSKIIPIFGIVFFLYFLVFVTVSVAKETLYLLSSTSTNETDQLVKVFQNENPEIIVKVDRLSENSALKFLRNQKGKTRYSVWLGPSVSHLILAKKNNLLARYKPKLEYTLCQQCGDVDGFWTGYQKDQMVIAFNELLLNRYKIPRPHDWKSLISNKFLGFISFPVLSSTSGFSILSSLIEKWGEEQTTKFFKNISQNALKFNKLKQSCYRQLTRNEVAACPIYLSDILKFELDEYSISFSIPEDIETFNIFGVALIAQTNRTEQDVGKIFIDWVLSRKTKRLFIANQKIPLLGLPLFSKYGMFEFYPKDDSKLYNLTKASKLAFPIVQKFYEITGSKRGNFPFHEYWASEN